MSWFLLERRFYIRMKRDSKVVVFGGNGLLGSAVCRDLNDKGYSNVSSPRSFEVDLMNKDGTRDYLAREKPDNIFMVAGLVGGIAGNTSRRADFLYENATMVLNLFDGVRKYSPNSKILHTGSTCIYPKENPQPISEDRFMGGKLEESNKGYAVAK